MFDDLYFVDLVVIGPVLCQLRFIKLCLFSLGFNFDFFSSTSQEISWEECLCCDLFSVESDLKP